METIQEILKTSVAEDAIETDEIKNSDVEGSKMMRELSFPSRYQDIRPPPDGGWSAWTQAGLGHLVTLNTWGLVNSFGIFQAYYSTKFLPTYSLSSISWIGSIHVFILFFAGALTGRISDGGFFRSLFLIGSLFSVFGLLMTSLATTYWQLFLAQGICNGLGNSCLFVPSLSILSTYFSKKRTLAFGIHSMGSATGGMLYSALFSALLPKVGFPWTMRVASLIQGFCLVLCNIGIRPRLPPRKTGSLVDWKSFQELKYVLFAVGMFFNFWSICFIFFYLPFYCAKITGLPYSNSMHLLIILNGVGIIGRIVPNIIADYFLGPLIFLVIACISSALLSFCWISITSQDSLYAWAVIYGIAAAAVQSLYPAALSTFNTDLSMSGTRIGMLSTIISFSVLTGSPIAGFLTQTSGTYLYAQLFSGLTLSIGSGFLILASFAKSRESRDTF